MVTIAVILVIFLDLIVRDIYLLGALLIEFLIHQVARHDFLQTAHNLGVLIKMEIHASGPGGEILGSFVVTDIN